MTAPTDDTLHRLLGRLALRDLPAPPRDLLATTHDLAIVHPGEPSSPFGLLLPKGLLAESRPARQRWVDFRPGTLARYSDAGRDVQVTVTGTRLPFDVALVDWLAYAVKCSGWTAEPPSRLRGPTERASVWAHSVGPTGARLRRVCAEQDADRVFEVVVEASVIEWSERRPALEATALGVVLLDADVGVGAEPRRRVGVRATGVTVEALHGGHVRSPVDGHIDLVLHRDRSLRGWVHRRAEPRGVVTAASRLRGLRTELQRRSYDVRGQALPVPLDLERTEFRRAPRLALLLDARSPLGTSVQVRCWQGESPTHAIDVMLVGPPPGRAHLDWMRGMRALELAFGAAVQD